MKISIEKTEISIEKMKVSIEKTKVSIEKLIISIETMKKLIEKMNFFSENGPKMKVFDGTRAELFNTRGDQERRVIEP